MLPPKLAYLLLGYTRLLILTVSAVCVLTMSLFGQNTAPSESSNANSESFFETRIRPVLLDTCFPCHNETKSSGSLQVGSLQDLLTGGDSGAAIEPGKAEHSLLIKAISRSDDASAMPPEKNKALRQDQVADFAAWINAGAPWPASVTKFKSEKHWAFQPLQVVAPPEPTDASWIRNEIDAFIRTEQESAKVTPAAEADKLTLIRRATYDLTGLPPTPTAIQEFLSDESPKAWERLIDRLLESNAYGERWGRHWLDVVRYADTAGETADYPTPLAWKYRNYVIDSFNKDKPYDVFLQEQIAGDILGSDKSPDQYSECIAATGYVAISRRFGFDSENYHHLTIQDTLDTIGQSVLGLTIGCARCHDHKFDAITMKDYYALYGIFASTRYPFPGSEQKPRVRSMMPTIPPAEANRRWREHRQRVAYLTAELQSRGLPVPNAVLGSIADIDGDFELQAPAAGGSKGVLVPPWVYEGNIEVTNAAQSPFKNLFPSGRVGAHVPSSNQSYLVQQALYSLNNQQSSGACYINLDFRLDAGQETDQSTHWFVLSNSTEDIITVSIGRNKLNFIRSNQLMASLPIERERWYNLRLKVDREHRNFIPTLASDQSTVTLDPISIDERWDGKLANVTLRSQLDGVSNFPGIAIDQFAAENEPIPDIHQTVVQANSTGPTLEQLRNELSKLVGIEGDLEQQSNGTPPKSPWNAGPNSVVKVSDASQSPYVNLYPAGKLGIFMPNRAEYDGFGCTFPNVIPAHPKKLLVSFDFSCSDVANGGEGTWRYYLGHGPGTSAAIEFFFNGNNFYCRSGDERTAITAIEVGRWYQVKYEIDFDTRTYTGTLESSDSSHPFKGALASGWDGAIDYTFIDSYGHIGGVRPALKADNFTLGLESFPDGSNPAASDDSAKQLARETRVRDLREAIAKKEQEGTALAEELNRLLIDGPFPMAYGLAEGTPQNVRIQKRGEPDQLGDEVPRGFVAILSGEAKLNDSYGSGRQDLADWLTAKTNPLTARVMVNRIWQYHFGRGLVKTPNDFGVRGMRPTHPELLDFLADRFMKSGWSVKAMHRFIMNSATYRQQSTLTEDMQAETKNRDLTDHYPQFPRRRISAEEIRDSILAVSGRLDRGIGTEHPFPSPISWGFSQHGPFSAVYDHEKRSVYLMVQRIKRHPYLALFDGADPNASTAVRFGTTVPTQALFFLNDPFVHQNADSWAARLMKEKSTLPDQVSQAYLEALGRPAATADINLATRFVENYLKQSQTLPNSTSQQALAAFLRTLFGSNAFLYID